MSLGSIEDFWESYGSTYVYWNTFIYVDFLVLYYDDTFLWGAEITFMCLYTTFGMQKNKQFVQ